MVKIELRMPASFIGTGTGELFNSLNQPLRRGIGVAAPSFMARLSLDPSVRTYG